MKIETKIIKDKNIRIHTIFGKFDIQEAFEYLDELEKKGPDFLKMNVCWNLLNSNISHLGYNTVKIFCNGLVKILETRKNLKIAFLMASDFSYGMARMMETLVEDDHNSIIEIFKNEEDAIQWLENEQSK